MSVVLVRPDLPFGRLPVTNVDFTDPGDYDSWNAWETADVVDARIIVDNWSILFGHVNGGLNGTDLDPDTADQFPEDEWVVNPENATPANQLPDPATGLRHSHDGVDSAYLAAGVVTGAILGDRARGIFLSPSKAYRTVLLHGRLAYEKGLIGNSVEDIPSDSNIRTLAVPWDRVRWGSSAIQQDPTASGSGTVRMLVQWWIDDSADYGTTRQQGMRLPIADVDDVGADVGYFKTSAAFVFANTNPDLVTYISAQWALLVVIP